MGIEVNDCIADFFCRAIHKNYAERTTYDLASYE